MRFLRVGAVDLISSRLSDCNRDLQLNNSFSIEIGEVLAAALGSFVEERECYCAGLIERIHT